MSIVGFDMFWPIPIWGPTKLLSLLQVQDLAARQSWLFSLWLQPELSCSMQCKMVQRRGSNGCSQISSYDLYIYIYTYIYIHIYIYIEREREIDV